MYDGDYDYALKVFNNVIVTDPKWSEAWNKRATLFFFMKNFQGLRYDGRLINSAYRKNEIQS